MVPVRRKREVSSACRTGGRGPRGRREARGMRMGFGFGLGFDCGRGLVGPGMGLVG